MNKKDYYHILGVPPNASEEEIKKAYRRLVMKYHPDRNPDPDATEKMKEINEAFAVLSDPVKRQKYDRYGHKGLEGYTLDDIFGGVDFESIFAELGLRNIFSEFFKGFDFRRSIFDSFFGEDSLWSSKTGLKELTARKGADIHYELDIKLEDAFWGTGKKIKLSKTEICQACLGTGAAKGGLSICRRCQGKGQVIYEQRSGWSIFRQISTCPSCRGQGKLIITYCKNCDGEGVVKVEKEIFVKIPRGADTGQVIKVEGEGEASRDGGVPGDLYIRLRVEDHPNFRRKGADLYVKKEIPFTQAILGGKIYGIAGIDEELSLEIPEGTWDGTIFKLNGKGMPTLNGERGDLYVEVKVNVPKDLNYEEKALLYSFERLRALKFDPLFLSQYRFGLPALPMPRGRNSGA